MWTRYELAAIMATVGSASMWVAEKSYLNRTLRHYVAGSFLNGTESPLAMLRRIRHWYKVYFSIDFLLELARLCVVVVVGTVSVVLLVVRRDFDHVLPVLARVVGAVVFLGLTVWIYYDAPRALRAIREQRQQQREKQREEQTD